MMYILAFSSIMKKGDFMRKPSLRKQPISTYIFFGIWLALSVLIIAESAMPGKMSSNQSNFVGSIFQLFFPEDKFSQETSPESYEFGTNDIVFENDGKKELVIGTTTTYDFYFTYPELKDNQYKKYLFPIVKKDPSESFSANNELINLGSDHYQMNVTTYKEDKDLSITIKISDSLEFALNFDICPRYIPSNDMLKNKSPKSISLKNNESYMVDVSFLKDGEEDYLIFPRYYDLSKLERSSTNEGVATIDNDGLINAKSAGKTTITYGPFSYDVFVSSESKSTPAKTFEYSQQGDFLAIGDTNYLKGGQSFTFSFDDLNVDDSFDFELVSNDTNIDSSALLLRTAKNACLIKGNLLEKEISLLVKASLKNEISLSIPLSFGEVKPEILNGISIDGAPSYIDSEGNLNVTVPAERDITLRGLFLANDRCVSLSKEAINITLENSNVKIIKNQALDCSINFGTIDTFEGKITSLDNNDLSLTVKFTTYDAKTSAMKEFLQLVRKSIGHFSLFMVHAIFMFLFLYKDLDDKYAIFTSGCTLFYSFVMGGFSELVQFYTPGRTCTWTDVGIDTLGGTLGVFLCLAVIGIIALIKYLKKKKISVIDET